MNEYSIRIAEPHFEKLMSHLFPGDRDEHGAVLSVGVSTSGSSSRLLVRDIYLAEDGVDYVPGEMGYRMLTPDFVARTSHKCASSGLGYLAVHCHRGTDHVSFSSTDLQSHKRGYPSLLDITRGGPVGALVFAEDAVAGSIWTPTCVSSLEHMTVVGPQHKELRPRPLSDVSDVAEMFHRQSQCFGRTGQAKLQRCRVGIIGLGGAGSLISQSLAHLGVGEIIAVDFDKVEPSNRSRIVGASRWDAKDYPLLQRQQWLRQLSRRLSTHKVHVAKRVAMRANPEIKFTSIIGNLADRQTAMALKDTDFLFLCADNAQCRLVFNALVHQYLIPGIQVGCKIPINQATGTVEDIFTVSRPVYPFQQGGCLVCNDLVQSDDLQREALDEEERDRAKYVDDQEVTNPSVITLNGDACSQATNDFLLSFQGLMRTNHAEGYVIHYPRERRWSTVKCRSDEFCRHCGSSGRSVLASGDLSSLPCKEVA